MRDVDVFGAPTSAFVKVLPLRHFQRTRFVRELALSFSTMVDLADAAGAHARPVGGVHAPVAGLHARQGSHVADVPA